MRACGLVRLGISLLLFLAMAQVGYGQTNRVYGSRDVINAVYAPITVFPLHLGTNGVENRANAYDDPLTNYSGIRIVLLGSAWQVVRFPADKLPSPRSPVYMQWSVPGSTLDLLSDISIQKTLGDAPANVGNNYSGGSLLGLLGVLDPNAPVEIELPPENTPFDGVRLQIGGTLAVGLEARYYFCSI